jgi:hypothetical protein
VKIIEIGRTNKKLIGIKYWDGEQVWMVNVDFKEAV